jgi:hypothetical protein
MIVKGIFLMRTVWPTGLSGPNSSFAVFDPMTATLPELRASRLSNIEPAASFQLLERLLNHQVRV